MPRRTQNVVACVNRAGVAVVDTVLEQLAAAEAVLTPDETRTGRGAGGRGRRDHRLRDLRARQPVAHGRRGRSAAITSPTTSPSACARPCPTRRRVKRRAGCALSLMVGEDETMEVASVGGRQPRVMARRILAEVLQPRAEEVFHLLWDEIQRAGWEKSLHSGIVLTGGGALLDGMAEIAEQIFDLPIRRGYPAGVGGLVDHVNSPAFATAVGIVMYVHKQHQLDAGRATAGAGALSRVAGRLRSLFREFF